ncbi:cyclic nucleotide-binding domain-containing protein, partial [bacterium]|nr:cyclic nucleotide-binding domain-containing protein [bacterium]
EDSVGTVYAYGQIENGQVFGELALLRGDPSRVTATTTRDSEFLVIDRAMLLILMRSFEPEQFLNIFLTLNEQTRIAAERGFREVLLRRTLALQMEVE